ncbi:putative ABC transport system ATP-binding protein [Pilibacter termitis]|uniref:Putative ABC transport system ATP-binding protein n=1 Tax=Pilibacter termitis TaxID=263852 RepID=A0A1T4LXS1_9ENTE|nr:ABC transporter ATP-binding protein [Pilibacter termitis]SJZ59431.1 putative ABC transport system ATP-binding protein [Pilibacter termitis]
MSFVKVNHVKKQYQTKFSATTVQALKDVHFEVEKGEFISIMGESGSGKSTLLNILATLDVATEGEVLLDGKDLANIPEGKLAAFRRDHLGFVFQDFNLLDTFTVRDNIYLPLVLAKQKLSIMEERIKPLAKQLAIEELLEKHPFELSGGQKQRVAIARALITQPEIVLADEPTGALDSKNSEEVLEMFERINAEGQTLLMVTHSALAASRSSRVLFIKDGRVFHQLYRAGKSHEEFFNMISNTMTNLLSTRGE